MYFTRIPSDTTVLPIGRERYHSVGEEAVLLLHGWCGWTGRVAYLAERLADAGFTVSVPRLPGHGTNMADMLTTGHRDWIRGALDAYLDLQFAHPTTHVVGHSMGAILAALIAAQFHVPKLALLAPAFTNTDKLILLAPVLGVLVRRIKSDWDPQTLEDPEMRAIGREYGTYSYSRMASELLKLQRMGRRSLKQVSSDTLVVVSESDRTVPLSVAALIEKSVASTNVSTVVTKESGHQIAEDVDRDEVAEAVISWFDGRR